MHPEVLDDKRRGIFRRLTSFGGFYLAGGTALALQIGHRISVDFDLFSDIEISQGLFKKVKSEFKDFAVAPTVNNREELTVLANDVKITFLYYPFPVLQNYINYDGVNLLSVSEIAVTKTYTIGRRGSYKDYVDMFYLLSEHHVTLEEIIAGANKKFGYEFNDRLFLEQLVYLEDITEEPIIFLKKAVSKKELGAYFEDLIGKMKL